MPSAHTESCRMCKEVDVQCQPEVETEGRDRRNSSKETQEIKDINGEIGTASMVSVSRFSLGTVGGQVSTLERIHPEFGLVLERFMCDPVCIEAVPGKYISDDYHRVTSH